MVSSKSVYEQLKRINFSGNGWGRNEIRELPNILLPDEEIYECANGIYEGGFALLVATNYRVLLVDKKPMKYLTIEDLRFDMINEIDYSHRLFGAQIKIATGSKSLYFRSYNQPRLRKLIGHVQHCMAEAKQRQSDHAEGQNQHLERINQQLQTYLLAQLEHQQELTRQLDEARQQGAPVGNRPPEVKPDPELADYLFAQSLLRDYQAAIGQPIPPPASTAPPVTVTGPVTDANDLLQEGRQEVFGQSPASAALQPGAADTPAGLVVNPLKVAYSKLPLAMRNRKFGRPVWNDPRPPAPTPTTRIAGSSPLS